MPRLSGSIDRFVLPADCNIKAHQTGGHNDKISMSGYDTQGIEITSVFPPLTGLMFPTEAQRLLLRSALGTGDDAVDAWQQWQSNFGFSTLDEEGRRLLPMIRTNLRVLGYEQTLPSELNYLGHRVQIANQQILKSTASVVDLLAELEIPCMALKGVALILKYYESFGFRPMGDFDLLVPTGMADKAFSRLRQHGWGQPDCEKLPGGDIPLPTRFYSGFNFVNDDGAQCDLHWHLLHDCCFDGADDDFWEHSEACECNGSEVRLPSATDLFLHTCVHGAMFNGPSPTRWIPDAIVILRKTGGQLDWDRLLNMSQRNLFTKILQESFRCLEDTVSISIPDGFREQLYTQHVPFYERCEYRLRTRDTKYQYTPAGRWCQLSRQNADCGFTSKLACLPGFISQIWKDTPKRNIPAQFYYLFVPATLRHGLTMGNA